MKTATFTSSISNAFGFGRTDAPATAPATAAPRKAMTEVLKSVRPIYRTPFLMFYKGYSYEEIAAELKLPVGTVKSRIFSARVSMKTMLANQHAA